MRKDELIKTLLSYGKEGIYWDFKQEFHSSLHELLYDITCMSNVLYDGDRYIVFGISDDRRIRGVNDHEYNQAKIIDFLRTQPYAEHPPSIELDDCTYDNKKIQILTIKNEPKKPFYFTKDISSKNQTKDRIIARAGVIYSRNHDSNTPRTSCAHPSEVITMWKERFGLNLTITDQFKKILKDLNWHSDGVSTSYYSFDPRLTIELSKTKEVASGNYWWSCMDKPLSFNEFNYILRSSSTIIETITAIHCYFEHLSFPLPTVKCVTHPENGAEFYCDLFYYIKDTLKHSLLEYEINNQSCSLNKDGFIVSGTKTSNAIIKLPFFIINTQDENALINDYLEAYKEFIHLGLAIPNEKKEASIRLKNEREFSLWAFKKLYHKYSK